MPALDPSITTTPNPTPPPSDGWMNQDLKEALAMGLLQMGRSNARNPMEAFAGLTNALASGYVGHKIGERKKAKRQAGYDAYKKTGDIGALYAVDPDAAKFYAGRSDKDRDYELETDKFGYSRYKDARTYDQDERKFKQEADDDALARAIAQNKEEWGQSGMARRLYESGQLDPEGMQVIAGTRGAPSMELTTTADGRTVQYDTKNPAGYATQFMEMGRRPDGTAAHVPANIPGAGGKDSTPASILLRAYQAQAIGVTDQELEVLDRVLEATRIDPIRGFRGLPSQLQDEAKRILAKIAKKQAQANNPDPGTLQAAPGGTPSPYATPRTGPVVQPQPLPPGFVRQ